MLWHSPSTPVRNTHTHAHTHSTCRDWLWLWHCLSGVYKVRLPIRLSSLSFLPLSLTSSSISDFSILFLTLQVTHISQSLFFPLSDWISHLRYLALWLPPTSFHWQSSSPIVPVLQYTLMAAPPPQSIVCMTVCRHMQHIIHLTNFSLFKCPITVCIIVSQ